MFSAQSQLSSVVLGSNFICRRGTPSTAGGSERRARGFRNDPLSRLRPTRAEPSRVVSAKTQAAPRWAVPPTRPSGPRALSRPRTLPPRPSPPPAWTSGPFLRVQEPTAYASQDRPGANEHTLLTVSFHAEGLGGPRGLCHTLVGGAAGFSEVRRGHWAAPCAEAAGWGACGRLPGSRAPTVTGRHSGPASPGWS